MATVYPPETNSGSVTSWLPLTTVYTPQTGCASKFRLLGSMLVAYDPAYGLDFDHGVQCAPDAVTTWWYQARLGNYDQPGRADNSIGPVTCPNSWLTLSTYVHGPSTQVMCCPPSYYLAGGLSTVDLASLGMTDLGRVVGFCASDVAPGTVLTYASTPQTDGQPWKATTTSITERSTVSAVAVIGWNIALKATVASTTTTNTTTSSPTGTPTPAGTAPSTPSTPTPSAPAGGTANGASSSAAASHEAPSTGLSTGAVAGIGVGVGVAVVALAALLVAFYLKRRSRRARMAAEEAEDFAARKTVYEAGSGSPPQELNSASVYQFDTEAVYPELPVRHPPQELPVRHPPQELA